VEQSAPSTWSNSPQTLRKLSTSQATSGTIVDLLSRAKTVLVALLKLRQA
jgi:hypothetical protein